MFAVVIIEVGDVKILSNNGDSLLFDDADTMADYVKEHHQGPWAFVVINPELKSELFKQKEIIDEKENKR